jgi:hypothetical protein
MNTSTYKVTVVKLQRLAFNKTSIEKADLKSTLKGSQ